MSDAPMSAAERLHQRFLGGTPEQFIESQNESREQAREQQARRRDEFNRRVSAHVANGWNRAAAEASVNAELRTEADTRKKVEARKLEAERLKRQAQRESASGALEFHKENWDREKAQRDRFAEHEARKGSPLTSDEKNLIVAAEREARKSRNFFTDGDDDE